jgi:hypothetical protein
MAHTSTIQKLDPTQTILFTQTQLLYLLVHSGEIPFTPTGLSMILHTQETYEAHLPITLTKFPHTGQRKGGLFQVMPRIPDILGTYLI